MLTINILVRNHDAGVIVEMLHFALDGKLENDTVVNVIEQDRVLDRLSTPDFELLALTYPAGLPHTYSLVIRTTATDIERIVFHEAIHLQQYESGRLKLNTLTGRAEWEGVLFSARFPYRSRPWEKEAFRGQDILFKAWRAARKERRRNNH